MNALGSHLNVKVEICFYHHHPFPVLYPVHLRFCLFGPSCIDCKLPWDTLLYVNYAAQEQIAWY